MPKFPQLSGTDVIKVLERKGYIQMRTRGTHVRLYPSRFATGLKKTTVPLHKHLKSGTLRSIMKDTGLVMEDFL
jgi:predicted RNA binding protein YcfA (HicA-like mRNA interferase family)